MEFKEIKSPAPFHRAVLSFWELYDPSAAAGVVEPVIPDGHAELIVQLGDPFRRLKGDGTWEKQSSVLLVGQQRSPVPIAPTGPVHMFGIRFQPCGAVALFDFPMNEISETVSDLRNADLPGAEGWAERLLECHTFEERVVESSRWLSSVWRPERIHNELSGVVSTILKNALPVDTGLSQTGWSVRQMERLFRSHVGIEPKTLMRITRFQNVLKRLGRDGDPKWVEIALDAGYYDQSHLIRDFRAFTGSVPSQYAKLDARFSEYFTAKKRMSYFSNISDGLQN